MSLSLAKIRADPYAQRLSLLGETTITDPVSNITTTPIVDLEGLQELIVQCVFAYGSAGEQADFWVQSTFDNGTTWTDIAAFRFPGVTGRLATDFDGSADYYNRASDLAGNADGKVGIFSLWTRIDGANGSVIVWAQNTSYRIYLSRTSDNKIRIFARNGSDVAVLDHHSTSTYTASSDWLHILSAWDVSNSESYIYVDDVSVGDTPVTLNDDTIDYTRPSWGIAAINSGSNLFNGAISEFYFALEYLDISVEANRRKFISAAGHPVPLGADGSTPTGNQPIIYARDGDASNNLGSGGNFTAQGSPTSTPGPNVEDTRFQAIKSVIATAANQSNQDGAMDANSILDGCLGSQLRVKYSTLGVFAGDTTIKIDALARG